MTIDLDQLEARAKAATPGPWEDLSEHPDHLRGTINKGAKHIAGCSWFETPREEQCVTVKEALANAAFIAAANPAVVLELIAEIRELQKKAKKECFIQEVEEEPDFTDSDAWGITREPSYGDDNDTWGITREPSYDDD